MVTTATCTWEDQLPVEGSYRGSPLGHLRLNPGSVYRDGWCLICVRINSGILSVTCRIPPEWPQTSEDGRTLPPDALNSLLVCMEMMAAQRFGPGQLIRHATGFDYTWVQGDGQDDEAAKEE